MASDAETGERRNDVLSRSYIQGVGRVAHQENDAGFSFELPKEVLEKREKVWDNLFDKYADEVSDEIELNIDTMEPVATADEEEGEDDDDEEDDEEPEEYYSKCRAPMRKLPALIQYWIDTGNPPYLLLGNDDNSGTGSSLSEGEHSRAGHSDMMLESSEKLRRDDASPCSSVDTAAYILSNANVTKKAETIALVEGARKPVDAPNVESSAINDVEIARKCAKNSKKDIAFHGEEGAKAIAKNSCAQEFLEAALRDSTNPSDSSHLNDPSSSPALDRSSLSQRSVKLSEVLPTLEQFDALFDASQAMRPPLVRVRSSLSSFRRKSKIDTSTSAGTSRIDTSTNAGTSKSSSLTLNGVAKSRNRRKLYTGRDSPVDLASERDSRRKLYTERNSPVDLLPERTSIDSIQSIGDCLHPALKHNFANRPKISSFASRARARRKRKRASQAAEILSQENNTSQESATPNGNGTSKGDMRYSDFFESLGLTPSKTIIGEASMRKSLPKRPRKSASGAKQRKSKEKVKLSETIESSMKETGDTTQNSEESFVPKVYNESPSVDATKKISGEKILEIRVERLSDDCLALYRRKDGTTKEHDREIVNSAGKKRSKVAINENIELLTTATHDSDSSTILICACNNDNNGNCSESDNSLFTKNVKRAAKKSSNVAKDALKRSLRSKEAESSAKINEVAKNIAEPTTIARAAMKNKKNLDSPNKKRDVIVEKSPKSPRMDEKINNRLNKKRENGIIEKSSKSPKKNEKIDNGENEKRDEIIERLSKSPKLYVSIEKLSMNDSSKVSTIADNSRRSKETESASSPKKSRFATDFSCDTEKSGPIDGAINFYDSTRVSWSETANKKCVTIGSRATTDSSDVASVRRKLWSTSCKPRISISSDDDEDSFAKIVKDFDAEKQKIGHEDVEKTKKIDSDKLINEIANGEESAMGKSRSPTRHRNNFGISLSSDSEDDLATRTARKIATKRRMPRVDSQKNIVDESVNCKKKILGNDLAKAPINGLNVLATVEKINEPNKAATKVGDAVRRSTRQTKPSNWDDIEAFSRKDSSQSDQLRDPARLLSNRKQSKSRDATVSPSRSNNRSRGSKNEKSVIDKSEKFKSKTALFAKLTRSQRKEKSSIGLNLARFKTRLDSDSDTDFESLRFSVNPKYKKSREETKSGAMKNEKKNCTEVFERTVESEADDKSLRASLRRSFRNSEELRAEKSEKELKSANSLDDSSGDTKRDSSLSKKDAKRSTSTNEFAPLVTSGARNSGRSKNNPKSQIEPREKLSPRKNSSKSERSRNASKTSRREKSSSSLPETRPNGESSPIPRKKSRRTKILGAPIEYESDDDESNEKKANSIETSRGKKSIFTNGASCEYFGDNNNASDDKTSSRKRREESKNLFSNSQDESVEDVDLLFGVDGETRRRQCKVVIDSLNFVTSSKRKNFNSVRQSTMSFRTKLRSDSDDENVL